MERYKILILVLPSTGHLNPLTSVVYELATKRGAQVIFYSVSQYKDMIQLSGAEYREYNNVSRFEIAPSATGKDPNKLKVKGSALFDLLEFLMHVSSCIQIEDLIKVVDEEQPDLIIYDFLTIYAKHLKRFLRKRYEK